MYTLRNLDDYNKVREKEAGSRRPTVAAVQSHRVDEGVCKRNPIKEALSACSLVRLLTSP